MLLPVLLRKVKMVQWLECLTKPYKTMLDWLQEFSDTTIENAKYNAQTHVFTELLQTKFPTLGVIVENSNDTTIDDVLIGTRVRNDFDIFIGTKINNNNNVSIGTRLDGLIIDIPDFYVKLISPASFSELIQLRSWINKYKIYSTTYQITDYTKSTIYFKNY